MSTEPPVVLITGATGPLGRAAAARFAADGARVALVGRDRARLEAQAAETGLAPDAWMAVEADASNPSAVPAMVDAVVARFGRIDVLLHLLGGYVGGTPVADVDPDELRTMIDRHLWSTFHVVRAVLPGMVERGFGRIIGVSSTFATTPPAGLSSYAVAKAAEEVLLRTIARETAGTGVTANVVVVRTIDTDHVRETAPTPKNASWATPEEITDALVYLASPASAAVTGVRLPLDGR